ncbi:MAG: class I SAM-dependent DNA methyltransferase [Paracoccaceae bacterium]
MRKTTPDLDAAYGLKTPKDNIRLYASWAKDYDQSFADEMDYQLPQEVARLFANSDGQGPVLDIGAGTGLAAEALTSHGIRPIDALDISQEMLSVAALKGVYRNLMVKDITIPFELGSNLYSGLISSGTFTTGHVGPEALDHLLAIALPGALFALSINAFHWKTQGFESKFSALDEQIYNFKLVDVAIYGARNTSSHKDDNGRIALFKKQ